ncbi:MAG: carboxypeptidase-like regulatory domain-containing protein [Flavobacteriaceae bacterium]|nr:carboxypeptidase-like regulatory domain-containing protein [Flavobacteriaceae bacterium]
MTSTEKGKFCNSCTKEIFDFTHYSDEQLIKRFEKEGDLCGRFTTTQLNRDLVLQRKKSHNYLSYAFSGIFSLLLLNSDSSKAQEKPKTIQTDKKFTSIPLHNTHVADSITVTGTVLDETNMPLPGATVLIKGTINGASTDFDGKFSLECKNTDVIIISYVGYFEYETPVEKTVHVNLKLDKSLGNVVVTAMGFVRKQNEINTSLKLKDSIKKATINEKVTGIVLDETNMPLPGAGILIKGTTTGTYTDFDGVFSLDCKASDILVISYIGYHDNEMTIDKDTIKINLDPDSSHEDIVIVTGGIYAKKRWIGANLFTRFTNLFRKDNKNPKYRF